MKKLMDLARCKGSVTKDVEAVPYDHSMQRRKVDLSTPGLKHAFKSSTLFDGEGSNEADS